MAAIHTGAGAVHVLLLLVVVAIFCAAAVVAYRGAWVAGLVLAVVGLLAAVALL